MRFMYEQGQNPFGEEAKWVNKDFYAILGVNKSSTAADIKGAYFKLAQEYHPDKTKDDKAKTEIFLEIQQAYEVLSDAKKRVRYDDLTNPAAQPNQPGTGNRTETFSPAQELESIRTFIRSCRNVGDVVRTLEEQIRQSKNPSISEKYLFPDSGLVYNIRIDALIIMLKNLQSQVGLKEGLQHILKNIPDPAAKHILTLVDQEPAATQTNTRSSANTSADSQPISGQEKINNSFDNLFDDLASTTTLDAAIKTLTQWLANNPSYAKLTFTNNIANFTAQALLTELQDFKSKRLTQLNQAKVLNTDRPLGSHMTRLVSQFLSTETGQPAAAPSEAGKPAAEAPPVVTKEQYTALMTQLREQILKTNTPQELLTKLEENGWEAVAFEHIFASHQLALNVLKGVVKYAISNATVDLSKNPVAQAASTDEVAKHVYQLIRPTT
jgi:curved DNA-binding protein CbpA